MDKIVEYIIVNEDLGMGVGKIASQVAHAQTTIDMKMSDLRENIFGKEEELFEPEYPITEELYIRNINYNYWFSHGQAKVILKANEGTLREALKIGALSIVDAGNTEVAPGSLTVVAFYPQQKSNLHEFTKNLKLL